MFRTMPHTYPAGVGTIGPRKCSPDLVDLPKDAERAATLLCYCMRTYLGGMRR